MSDEDLAKLAREAREGAPREALDRAVARGLSRFTHFRKAFDRDKNKPNGPGDSNDYGTKSVEMWLGVRGPLGAATLIVSTQWDTKAVREERGSTLSVGGSVGLPHPYCYATGRDVSVCVPRVGEGRCPALGCYCERAWTSALRAEQVFDLLTDKGEDAAYGELARIYASVLYLGELDTLGKLKALVE